MKREIQLVEILLAKLKDLRRELEEANSVSAGFEINVLRIDEAIEGVADAQNRAE
jgi:hypothetical protein